MPHFRDLPSTACYFPARAPGGEPVHCWYEAFTGTLWVGEHALSAAQPPTLDTLTVDDRQTVLSALCDSSFGRKRWGGINLPEKPLPTVGQHACFVARRAAQLARALDMPEPEVALAFQVGAFHDLHEDLPGVGDVLAPVLRHLIEIDPTIADIHEGAKAVVRRLLNVSDVPKHVRLVVKAADRDAAALERAVYFEGPRLLPGWLWPRSKALVEKASLYPFTRPGSDANLLLEAMYAPHAPGRNAMSHWTGWLKRAIQPCGGGYVWALADLEKLPAGTIPVEAWVGSELELDRRPAPGWDALSELRHEVFGTRLPPLPEGAR